MPDKILTLKADENVGRANNFDLVRLFGALLVVYGHSYALVGGAAPGFAANSVSTIGLKIFFVISGFLVAASWLRDPNLARFFMRRSLRILPALATVVLLSAFVMGPLVSKLPLPAYLADTATWRYLQNCVLHINYDLPGVFTGNVYPNAVNGSLWSLPVEYFMYIVTPLIVSIAAGLGGPRGSRLVMLSAWLGSIAVTMFVVPVGSTAVFYATPVGAGASLVPYFIAGMALSVCRLERWFNIYTAFAALFVIAVSDTSATVKELMLMVVLPYGILSFGVGSLPVSHCIKGNDISFGMFLYAFPIQQLIMHYRGAGLLPWELLVLTLPIAAAFGFASWHLIEKPALALKPKTHPVEDPQRALPIATTGSA